LKLSPQLRRRNQWANWRGDKVVYNSRTRGKASSTDPSTWSSFEQACKRDPARLAYVFSHDDGLVGLDVDGCRNPETGEIDARGTEIMDRFPDLYWEVSLNSTGLHGIGYGTLPIDTSGKHPHGIGIFHHSRYFVMTGRPLRGYEMLGSFGDGLADWYFETFGRPTPDQSRNTAPLTVTLDDHGIIEQIRRWPDGDRLMSGDNAGYDDYSKPRMVLANKIWKHTNDPEQIARILRVADLFDPANSEQQRDRKAKSDALKAIQTCTGSRYGDHPHLRVVAEPANTDELESLSKPELIRIIHEQTATIAERDRRIESQQRTIRYERSLNTDIETILAASDIEAGPKLTAIGLYIEITQQHERGRQPDEERGFQIPAVWISRRTGITPKTSNRHLQVLDGKKIIDRKVVNLTKGEEAIDNETGEILTVDVPRKVGFIASTAEAIVTNIADYRRQEDDEGRDELGKQRHGGKRTPRCPDHPNAGTVKKWTIHCAECDMPLDADDGIPNLGTPEHYDEDVATSKDIPKMGTPSSDGVGPPKMPYSPPPPGSPTPIRPAPTLDEQFVANGWD
jgi:hypothetical protein